MEQVLIEWTEGCGRDDLVGKRIRMGGAQATNQIAKGRAILVEEKDEDETEDEARSRRSRKRKTEETAGADE